MTDSLFFGGIFSLFVVIVLSFYFALQDTGVEDFLRLVTPRDREEYVIDLWHRSQVKIGQWMQGQLLLSLIAAIIIFKKLVHFTSHHLYKFRSDTQNLPHILFVTHRSVGVALRWERGYGERRFL